MITNREMYCTISSCIVSTIRDKKMQSGLLRQLEAQTGISHSEALEILDETKQALSFMIEKMLKDMVNTESGV